MTAYYSTTLSLSIGGDTPTWEGEATVCYSVTWGAPEKGPTYACGGQPADPDEIDAITVTHIDGAVVVGEGLTRDAETLQCHIECNDRLTSLLLEHAYEMAAEERAAAMDYRYELARDDARIERMENK